VHVSLILDSSNCAAKIGVVPAMAPLILSSSDDLAEQAIWALGNIAGDGPHHRDVILKSTGALDSLCSVLSKSPPPKSSLVRNAVWLISNLCRGKPEPSFDDVKGFLQIFPQILLSKDREVLSDCLWALSYLADDNSANNSKIQAVLQSGVAQQVVGLLMHPDAKVVTPALRTVGNIVSGVIRILIKCHNER
jgi:importin subunit alpha-6/7